MAKGTSFKDNAALGLIGRHVDTMMRYAADPSPRKERLNSGVLKTITTRNLRNVKKKMLRNPGLTSNEIFS